MQHSHHIRSNYATRGDTHRFRSRRHRSTTGSVLSPIIPPENALLTPTLVQESKPIGICHRSFPALVRQLDVGWQGTAALGSVILVVSVIVVGAAEYIGAHELLGEWLEQWNTRCNDDGTALDARMGQSLRVRYVWDVISYHVQMTRSEVSKEKSSLARFGRRVVL